MGSNVNQDLKVEAGKAKGYTNQQKNQKHKPKAGTGSTGIGKQVKQSVPGAAKNCISRIMPSYEVQELLQN